MQTLEHPSHRRTTFIGVLVLIGIALAGFALPLSDTTTIVVMASPFVTGPIWAFFRSTAACCPRCRRWLWRREVIEPLPLDGHIKPALAFACKTCGIRWNVATLDHSS